MWVWVNMQTLVYRSRFLDILADLGLDFFLCGQDAAAEGCASDFDNKQNNNLHLQPIIEFPKQGLFSGF